MRKSLLKFIAVIIGLYLILSQIYSDKFPRFPELLFFAQNGIKNSYTLVTNTKNAYQLVKQNHKVTRKYFASKKEQATLRTLLKNIRFQNRRYKQALKFKKYSTYKIIPAQIISRSTDNWYSFVIIDQGTAQGVAKNDPVIVEQGIVGEVTQTYLNHSKVTLLTDKTLRAGCMIKRTGDIGIAKGYQLNKLQINYIPKDSQIVTGDLIVSSGQNSKFPKGLPIGTIKKITTTKAAIFKNIQATPVVNLSKLTVIFVLKGNK